MYNISYKILNLNDRNPNIKCGLIFLLAWLQTIPLTWAEAHCVKTDLPWKTFIYILVALTKWDRNTV